ncbi:multidrug effflux MFS transporter [Furfurilactobacillus siliginis]|uniref:Bcr/CflA family efflux transporter n=1 Tax=Furfurilactobacillus siliginis TaxID=348151 RepID=A0A0R2KYD7_9LACO|nr:multidrug effflux MFS transporter [Furfurilactobacillus siliginis]KRN94521.1 Permease of the major facilitator superfamily protein [Furfurilactobacillus siliginis]GEK28562.1 Bcr/CflA family drug resistance efflux transporter [Furfurilactobacillus siliginis]
MTQTQKIKPSRFLTFLLGTLAAFGSLSLDMYLPALPNIQATMHTSAGAVQASISTCLIGMAVGQLLIGPWSDRVGRRLPFMTGLIAFTLASFDLIFAHNIIVFLVLRFVQGLAGSTGQVLSRAMARDLFEGPRLTKFYATLMTVIGVFPVIAPILGAALIAFFSWQSLFITLTIIGAWLAVISFFVLPETITPKATMTQRLDFMPLLKNRAFTLNTLMLALVYGALFAYISDSSFIFQKSFGLSTSQFSLVYAVNGVGFALGSQLIGRLSGSFSDQALVRFGFLAPLLTAVVMIVNTFTLNNTVIFMLGLFLIVTFMGFNTTITTALAMESTTDNIGLASAGLGAVSLFIGGLSSPLVSLFNASNAIPMLAVIAGFELLGVVTAHFGGQSKHSSTLH